MKKTEQKYQAFVQILKEELIPAMGCTEPISLAYGASIARKVLNHLPTKIVVEASGSIIKNVKSVIVPHTHHLKGIKAAVCAGIIGGNDDKYLEVLSQIDEKTKKEIDQYIEKVDFEEHFLDSSKVFDYIITVWNKKEYVKVRISDSHMHVVCIEKNGQILQEEKRHVKKLKVVYSEEKPIRPIDDLSISCRTHCICPPGTKRKCTIRRDIPGSNVFVPSTVGLIIASEVVKDLTTI